MGGCGVTILSCHMMAILRGEVGVGFIWMGVHGRGISTGSFSQGLESMMVFMKRDMPVRLVLNGPIEVTIASAPGRLLVHPSVGSRKAVGFKP